MGSKDEEIIKKFFTEQGFTVAKLPESAEKSADFIVSDSHDTYLVEFKTKEGEGGLAQTRRETLEKGKIFEVEKKLGRNNNISAKVELAAKQIDTSSKHKGDFKIFWCHSVGRLSDVYFDQLKATLYGSADIAILDKASALVPCLYFTFSAFYRYRNSLDAAILSYNNKAQFCLNDRSPRYKHIKNTKLFKLFEGGIYDPIAEEAKGKAYIADCSLDRKNEGEILRYIQKKYKQKRMINMQMKFLSAEVYIDGVK